MIIDEETSVEETWGRLTMGTSKGIVRCETILILVVILVGFLFSKDKHHAWGVVDILPTDCGIFAYLSGLTRRECNGCLWRLPTDVLGFETFCTYFVSAALLAVVRDCANIIMIEYVCMHIFLYIDYRIWLKSGGLCHIIECDDDSSSMLLQCICKIDYLILRIYTYIYPLHTSKYLFVFESQNSCSHQSKNACSSGVTENCSWDQAHDKNAFVELKMFMTWIYATMYGRSCQKRTIIGSEIIGCVENIYLICEGDQFTHHNCSHWQVADYRNLLVVVATWRKGGSPTGSEQLHDKWYILMYP